MKLLLGDCFFKLKDLQSNSIDSIVTDPPYGLSFMNKYWDYDVPKEEIWKECLRVLKPGGHLLAFFGTRTYHRGVVRIEDAGFEIRDQIAWLYGQGFPKSTNVLKSGIKQGLFCECKSKAKPQMPSMQDASVSSAFSDCETEVSSLQQSMSEQDIRSSSNGTEPQESFEVREKSSLEGRSYIQEEQEELYRSEVCEMPSEVSRDGAQGRICNGASSDNGYARESLSESNGSCASQRSQYTEQSHNQSGTISQQSSTQTCRSCGKTICNEGLGTALKPSIEPIVVARKPLEKGLTIAENLVKWGTGAINIDECRVSMTNEDRAAVKAKANKKSTTNNIIKGFGNNTATHGDWDMSNGRWPANVILDEVTGCADWSRFFYVAKASKSERNKGLDGMPLVESGIKNDSGRGFSESDPYKKTLNQNHHPTVKPIKLMQYLIKLVTPPNGTVLDPFMGSGSTGVAAKQLGFGFVGIELNEDYFEISKNRIESSDVSLDLFSKKEGEI